MEIETATLREIYGQPQVWRQVLQTLSSLQWKELAGGKDPHSHEWLFVGCGTSYYLAQAAAATFTALTHRLARAVPASEILFASQIVLPLNLSCVLPVLISRSGHTSEILRVAEFFRREAVDFLAVTCDGNELAGLTPRILRLPVEEDSTVMTASFTSMLMGLQYMAARITGKDEFVSALCQLPEALDKLFSIYGPEIERFARQTFDDVAFLGQGALYPIASETALKVMESSSTYAQYFHTLEFRHGPKSVVSDCVLVGAMLSESSYADESAVLVEIKKLGARTMAIANRLTPEVRAAADLAIELALPAPELARLVVYVVWGQLLGSYLGLHKGLNPDSPRHLSRVVTLAE